MKGSNVAVTVVGTVFKFTIAAVIIFLVYNTAMKAYAFGYEIFAEEAMSTGTGTTVTITVTDGKEVMDIAKMLEEKGLIKSASLFYFQEKFSAYCDEIEPGVYELNTSMKPQEMIEIMATKQAANGEVNNEADEETEGITE